MTKISFNRVTIIRRTLIVSLTLMVILLGSELLRSYLDYRTVTSQLAHGHDPSLGRVNNPLIKTIMSDIEDRQVDLHARILENAGLFLLSWVCLGCGVGIAACKECQEEPQ